MNVYTFIRAELANPFAPRDVQKRDLPDDAAALEWMRWEVISSHEVLGAYRDGEVLPFAIRRFAENVQVVQR